MRSGLQSGDIIGYQLIRRRTREALVQAVMEAIKDGWEPLGGAMFDGEHYCQTVVKRRP